MTRAVTPRNYQQLTSEQQDVLDIILVPAFEAYNSPSLSATQKSEVSQRLLKVADSSMGDRQWRVAAALCETVLYREPMDKPAHHTAVMMVADLAPKMNGIEQGLATLTWALLQRTNQASPEYAFAKLAHPRLVAMGMPVPASQMPNKYRIEEEWKNRVKAGSTPASMKP